MAQTAKTKLTIIGVIIAAVIIGLVVWNQQKKAASDELVIGISPSFAKPLQVAAVEAKQQGLNVKLVEFSDWNTPNITLNHGDIDANFFQHQPFLDNAKKETDFKIKAFAKGAATHVGLYSKKIKSFDELKDGAKVVVPNDPVNQGRALLLLQQAKLITLKDPKNALATPKDIAENPKNLKFKELESAMLPRVLDQVDLDMINTNYALEAGLNPAKDALVIEGADSPYVNFLVARPDNKDSEAIQKLAKALTSPEVKEFIAKKYQGAVLPAF